MGDQSKQNHHSPTEDVIAAFDRERAEAHELHRRHAEHVRTSRSNDRPARSDRRQSRR